MATASSQIIPKEKMESLLKVAEKMDTTQLEQLADSILLIRARRRVDSSKETEAELLKKAMQDFTDAERRRFRRLIKKRQNDEINEDELQELFAYIEMSENLTARRVENVLKLAALKGIPFQEMYDQLGFKEHRNVL